MGFISGYEKCKEALNWKTFFMLEKRCWSKFENVEKRFMEFNEVANLSPINNEDLKGSNDQRELHE